MHKIHHWLRLLRNKRWDRLDLIVGVAVAIAITVGIVFLIWIFRGSRVTIDNTHPQALSPLTGMPCADVNQRPLAVMLSSDVEARPLAGIGSADVVVEMPVSPDGITRMMAIFQCTIPSELGSLRSARGDFIPLAQGFGALFVHWGGERDALASLRAHVIDNIDGLIFDGTTMYRKKGVPSPHDGFTTLPLLESRAEKLGYSMTATVPSWPHTKATPERNLSAIVDTIQVAWRSDMSVLFRYRRTTNDYVRSRGGTPEIDALTKAAVHPTTVIVMKTNTIPLYDQYIGVRTLGQGEATIYANGRATPARWQKQLPSDMLTFIGTDGKQIATPPGPVWILIDAHPHSW